MLMNDVAKLNHRDVSYLLQGGGRSSLSVLGVREARGMGGMDRRIKQGEGRVSK